ncbi:MAG: ABC transporter ATP-binding protein/permease [Ruminococcus sp.]|nr:ABC transporter ATP-binding protein/permease [Ruminococcus sp.]
MKKPDNQKVKNTWKCTKFVLSFVVGTPKGKLYLFLKGLISVLQALITVMYTVLPGWIINALVDGDSISMVVLYVGLLVLNSLIAYVVNSWGDYWLNKIRWDLDISFDSDFYRHLMTMDYENFENPNIIVMKNRANDTLSDILNYVDLIFKAVTAVFTLIAISSIIATLHPLIVVLVLAMVLINSAVTKKLNTKQFELNKENAVYSNRDWGLTYMMYEQAYGKENRLFSAGEYLISLFRENKYKFADVIIRGKRSWSTGGIVYTITSLVQQVVLYAYLIIRVIYYSLAIGSMTIYLSAVSQFSSALSNVFNTYLSLSAKSLNIQEYLEFMSLPRKGYGCGTETPVYDKDSIIEFKNVSFKYPGSEVYALKKLNLTLKGSEHLCVVGENGAGKSTFIKLLTRLYTPTEGEILLNGKNINEYDYEKYQRLFAPVFQDFVEYKLPLEKNITLSGEPCDHERLDEVCRKCGLTKLVAKLPKGYDTYVGKSVDEGGFKPSGGEGQRIAIARAQYHGGEIYLLDEPTAALDPNAEYEIYSQFNSMIQDKCAVLITHRLSAVQLADRVAVFQDGHMVGYGTHKELYAQGGLYTEMFDKQAEFYVKANEEAESEEI